MFVGGIDLFSLLKSDVEIVLFFVDLKCVEVLCGICRLEDGVFWIGVMMLFEELWIDDVVWEVLLVFVDVFVEYWLL